jgi:hypothetical protein
MLQGSNLGRIPLPKEFPVAKKSADNILTAVAKTVGSAIGTIANTVGVTGNGSSETQAAAVQTKKPRPNAASPKAHTKNYAKNYAKKKKKTAHKRKIKEHTAG